MSQERSFTKDKLLFALFFAVVFFLKSFALILGFDSFFIEKSAQVLG